MPLDQIILMPEVAARRALAAHSLALRVLAPVGHYAGRGVLRVLRAKPHGEGVELICGYESYESIA